MMSLPWLVPALGCNYSKLPRSFPRPMNSVLLAFLRLQAFCRGLASASPPSESKAYFLPPALPPPLSILIPKSPYPKLNPPEVPAALACTFCSGFGFLLCFWHLGSLLLRFIHHFHEFVLVSKSFHVTFVCHVHFLGSTRRCRFFSNMLEVNLSLWSRTKFVFVE